MSTQSDLSPTLVRVLDLFLHDQVVTEQRGRGRILAGLAAAVLVTCLMYIGVIDLHVVPLLNTSLCALGSFATLVLLKLWSVESAAFTLMISCAIVTGIVTVIGGGIDSPYMMYLIMLPFFGALIDGTRGAAFTAVFAVALASALLWGALAGQPFLVPGLDRVLTPNGLWDFYFSSLFMLLFGLVFLYVAYRLEQQVKAKLRESNSSLEEARDAAVEADSIKRDLLATVSHEIRTPMNGVVGMLDVLLKSDVTPQQRSQLETMQEGTTMLMHLLNDLLDLSRYERQGFVIEHLHFDLHKQLRASVTLMRSSASARGIRLQLHIDPNVPDSVTGDENRLRQVVFNLLNNAIKFGGEGVVQLTASLENGQVEIRVRDYGPGIPESQRELIFQAFERAGSTETGTGLGLTICRTLAHAMGGDLFVDSSVRDGACFVFRLPLQSTERRAVAEAENTLMEGFQGLRILVAEDNLINQRVVVAMLQSVGCRVSVVDTGASAIQAVRDRPFDLVLMDRQMPVLDGVSATLAIRELGFQVPIIALTASALDQTRVECKEAGMDGFLSKPIRRRALLGEMDRCLDAVEN